MSTDPTEPPGASSPPTPPAPLALPPATIHEAERASGASGGVIRGAEIDFATAVTRRQAGKDVVVCGPDLKANRRQAEQIEAAVGPWVRSAPHKQTAGPCALPHFQQRDVPH